MYARNKLLLSMMALSAVILLGGSAAQAGKDVSDLAGRARAWQEAFNAGDKDAVAALYTEDAARLPYQAPPVEGRAAIPANIQTTYDAGITNIALEVLGAESKGGMAWGHGTYKLVTAAGETVQQGKWMNVSKKVGSEWLIHCDMWNTNAPD